MGSADKTLLTLAGRPLVAHTLDGLRPQVGPIVIGCGRDPAPYASLGTVVVADTSPDQGPLGGYVSALPMVASDWLLVHPGDTPFPHPELVDRLARAAGPRGLAVPRTGAQRQHLVLLLSRTMADELAAFYRRGGRAVRAWLDEQQVEGLDMSDIADSFFNVNTPEDLAAAELRLAGSSR
jgi:molybdenum cofactor guanylyltransferase